MAATSRIGAQCLTDKAIDGPVLAVKTCIAVPLVKLGNVNNKPRWNEADFSYKNVETDKHMSPYV